MTEVIGGLGEVMGERGKEKGVAPGERVGG